MTSGNLVVDVLAATGVDVTTRRRALAQLAVSQAGAALLAILLALRGEDVATVQADLAGRDDRGVEQVGHRLSINNGNFLDVLDLVLFQTNWGMRSDVGNVCLDRKMTSGEPSWIESRAWRHGSRGCEEKSDGPESFSGNSPQLLHPARRHFCGWRKKNASTEDASHTN